MRNWPLILIVVISFASFAYGMGKMVTPEMYRDMSPPQLGYVFVPDDDTFVETNHYLEIRFIPFGPEYPVAATAFLSHTLSGDAEPLDLEPVFYEGEQTNKWIAILPPLADKGDRWFYYLTFETSEGRTIEIRKDMNWFEKLFTGFTKEKQLFWTTYEGNVIREIPSGKVLLVTHIVLTMGALLLLFHTLYYAFQLFAKPNRFYFHRAYKSAFWGILCFLVGAIIIGIPITAYTFGVGFMPWPTQGLTSLGDVTDTKSSAMIVAWAILLLANFGVYKRAFLKNAEPRKWVQFGVWVIIVSLFTVFIFLIPHSQFMQQSQM